MPSRSPAQVAATRQRAAAARPQQQQQQRPQPRPQQQQQQRPPDRRQQLQQQAHQALRQGQTGPVAATNKAAQSQTRQAQTRRQPTPAPKAPSAGKVTNAGRAPQGGELRKVSATTAQRNAQARGLVGDPGLSSQELRAESRARNNSFFEGGMKVAGESMRRVMSDPGTAAKVKERKEEKKGGGGIFGAVKRGVGGAWDETGGKVVSTANDVASDVSGAVTNPIRTAKNFGSDVSGAVTNPTSTFASALDIAGGGMNYMVRQGPMVEIAHVGANAFNLVGDVAARGGKAMQSVPGGDVVEFALKGVGGVAHEGGTMSQGMSNVLNAAGKAADAVISHPVGAPTEAAKYVWENKGAIASTGASLGIHAVKEQFTLKNLAINAALLGVSVASVGVLGPWAARTKAAMVARGVAAESRAVRAVAGVERMTRMGKVAETGAAAAEGGTAAKVGAAAKAAPLDEALASNRSRIWGDMREAAGFQRAGPVSRQRDIWSEQIATGTGGLRDMAARVVGAQKGVAPYMRTQTAAQTAGNSATALWRGGRTTARFGQAQFGHQAMHVAGHPATTTAVEKSGTLYNTYKDLRGGKITTGEAYRQVEGTGLTDKLPEIKGYSLDDLKGAVGKVAPYAGLIAAGGAIAGLASLGGGGGGVTTLEREDKKFAGTPIFQMPSVGGGDGGGGGRKITSSISVEDPKDWSTVQTSATLGTSAGFPDVTPQPYGRQVGGGSMPDVTPNQWGRQIEAPNLRGLTASKSRPGSSRQKEVLGV